MTAGALVLLCKLFLAWKLDLYSDEIFYWQASTRPALAYSDLPFITALLAGLGSFFGGNNPLAVRSLFLVLGTLLPMLVYWIARPLVIGRQATSAALFSLCLPLGAFLGLLAVPDVPLVFTGLLFIGCFERATRTGSTAWWLLAGTVAAAGFNIHYRFGLYPLAAFIYLCLTPSQRVYLGKGITWLAVLIMCLGLYPMISFNLATDLSGLGYHLLDRHPWTFQPEGFLHVFKQAGLVTPPLYLAMLATVWLRYQAWRNGDDRSGLILCFALTHLLIFLIAAPWADSTRTSIHWPLSGYFPLLVFLPDTLERLLVWLQSKSELNHPRRWVLAIPVLGFVGALVAFIGVGSQAFNNQLRPVLGTDVLSTKMAGWKLFNQELETLLDSGQAPATPVIITDNYYTAAQIEFAETVPGRVLTLDNDKAVRDGRKAQYLLWQADETGVGQHTGKPALLITEDSTLSLDDKTVFMSDACSHLSNLKFLKQASVFQGEKAYSFYSGIIIPETNPLSSQQGCPLPSQAWLDTPAAESTVSGKIDVSGWVFNNGVGISEIRLVLDGKSFSSVERRIPRPDVVELASAQGDPEQPDVGFSIQLDTATLENGWHDLGLEVTSGSGEVQAFRQQRFLVDNP